MPISSFNDLNQAHESLQASGLPVIVHGPLTSDISLICHGEITKSVIEAASFLDHAYEHVSINVVQIKKLDPLPVQDLHSLLISMKYLMLIESNVEIDLYKLISKQTGIDLNHHQYFNSNQSQLVAKIIAVVKQTFLVS